MKKRVILHIALNALFLNLISCSNEEILYVDVAPQLEISVVDVSENSIEGAIVTLYYSEADWESKSNLIKEKITGSEGNVLFKDLQELQYYFYVEKGATNNFYDVVTFSNPLKKNEIKAITCVIK